MGILTSVALIEKFFGRSKGEPVEVKATGSFVPDKLFRRATKRVQAMLHLADGKMDGNLFAEFLREAVSGITGRWQDESQSR
jgi:hypothetical protein